MVKLRSLRGLALAVTAVAMLGSSAAVAATPASHAQVAQSRQGREGTPSIDKFYPVVREAAAGLPDRTVYRPADLRDVGRSVPVVVWANGGCRPANTVFMSTLMLLAARGFIVVADGAPEAPSDTATGGAHPERMTEVIDWLEESRGARRQLGKRIDRSSIAVAGQSCGGIEALVAGADPRVDSVLSLNSGFFPTPPDGTPPLGFGRENLSNLHTPVLFLSGGPADVAHQNTIDNFNLVTVPAARVENPQGGHGEFFYGIRIGQPLDGTVTLMEETVEVLVNWLDFTLNGNRTAGRYFTGDCGLCAVPGWVVETKNGL